MATKDLYNMSFKKAINILAGKTEDNNEYEFTMRGDGSSSHLSSQQVVDSREAAIMIVSESVAYLAKTNTDGIGDWIYNGDFTGNETAQDLADEWDELSE